MTLLSVDVIGPAIQNSLDVYDENGNYLVELSMTPMGPKGDKGDSGGIKVVGKFGASKIPANLPFGTIPANWDAPGVPAEDIVLNIGDAMIYTGNSHIWAYVDIIGSPTGWVDIGLAGVKGDTGAQGPQGLQGPPGSQGPQGLQGEQGIPGTPGADGKDGLTPTVEMYGDQIMINGTVTGPHLTGPAGKDGQGGAGNQLGYMVKSIGAGFYYPTKEDVNTLLLNTFNIGGTQGLTGANDCVCYLPDTAGAPVPIGAEIQILDENIGDTSKTYFLASGSAVLHTADGAGANTACANPWDPIRAIKVTDADWLILGNTTAAPKPITVLKPATMIDAFYDEPTAIFAKAPAFWMLWDNVDANSTSQMAYMAFSGTSSVIWSKDSTGTNGLSVEPSIMAVNVPWQAFDFYVTSFGTEGVTPVVSNKISCYGGYPIAEHNVTTCKAITPQVSTSGTLELTITSAIASPYTQTDVNNQLVNGYELVITDTFTNTTIVYDVTGWDGTPLVNKAINVPKTLFTANDFKGGAGIKIAIRSKNIYGLSAGGNAYQTTVSTIAPTVVPTLLDATYKLSTDTMVINFDAPYSPGVKDFVTYAHVYASQMTPTLCDIFKNDYTWVAKGASQYTISGFSKAQGVSPTVGSTMDLYVALYNSAGFVKSNTITLTVRA